MSAHAAGLCDDADFAQYALLASSYVPARTRVCMRRVLACRRGGNTRFARMAPRVGDTRFGAGTLGLENGPMPDVSPVVEGVHLTAVRSGAAMAAADGDSVPSASYSGMERDMGGRVVGGGASGVSLHNVGLDITAGGMGGSTTPTRAAARLPSAGRLADASAGTSSVPQQPGKLPGTLHSLS